MCTEDLKARFEQVELAVARIKEGSDVIRSALDEINLLKEAETCVKRSQEAVDKIVEAAAAIESPAANLDSVLTELRRLDHFHRQEVQSIADIKVPSLTL